ncbi:putative amidohydrolase [Murinocardiopsis flavida]|uniref:Putative amidohydrolase n=1 Tax=Murinocardiopsis flavida TaxID=645275 RepID=A0A2P8DSX3_9ACTN|nr:carbon-nitrogen hydrolase family protein [Murinocardiopsis flavida]PSL00295.1 putative amidohydrolase [Murinocardiopsis flavida]
MRVAICQFEVLDDPVANARIIDGFAAEAAAGGARLLIAPEAALVRLPDKDAPLTGYAQALDGQFVTDLAASSAAHGTAIVAGSYTPGDGARVRNTLVAVDNGSLAAHYDKLHLYDAFSYVESDKVEPGRGGVGFLDLDGTRFGLVTCYDLRFPEIFRALVDLDAHAFALPAAWIRGPVKEEHWLTLLRARAIENTAYVLASGEAGAACIGRSAAFDPLGLQLLDLGAGNGIGFADVDRDRIDEVRAALPSIRNRRFDVVPR